MNRNEHLLIRAIEECAEVAQRITKAMVFGMEQVQHQTEGKADGNPDRLTNRERIVEEYNDLVAVMEMCGFSLSVIDGEKLNEKQKKVERYLAFSGSLGTLTD